MIAYHLGDGEIIPVGGGVRFATDVSYNDDKTHIDATNVQEAIENLYDYFCNKYPGWFKIRQVIE